MTLSNLYLFFHLLGFAAFIGAGFAQTNLLKASTAPSLPTAVRDAYERLTADISTRIELPAIFVSIVSGVLLLLERTYWLKAGWMHGKLTAVLLLLVLAHVEMINARRIVKARHERGDAASAEIDARKAKHAIFGAIGALLVAAVLVLVVFFRSAP